MQKILWHSAAGTSFQMHRLDSTTNNLANVNSGGFKSQEVTFSGLMRRQLDNEGNAGDPNTLAPVRSNRDFTQGPVVKSENPFSLAIEGNGFFRLEDSEGNEYYSRDGNFSRNAEGRLVNQSGYFLSGIELPEETSEVYISPDGTVEATVSGGEKEDAGSINLYLFRSRQSLSASGENLFVTVPGSEAPTEHRPGEGGTGNLRQGYQELSNTDTTSEMIKLVSLQRSLQLNTRAISVADQMWDMANNLRR